MPAAIAVGAYAILKDRGGPGSVGGVIAAVFIAGAAVTGFFLLALIGAAVTALGFGEIAAGLVVLAGIGLVVGAFSRRPALADRSRPSRWPWASASRPRPTSTSRAASAIASTRRCGPTRSPTTAMRSASASSTSTCAS